MNSSPKRKQAKGDKKAAAVAAYELRKTWRPRSRRAEGAGRPRRRRWASRRRRPPPWTGSITSIPSTTKVFTGTSASLWLAQQNYPGAIREFTALVAMHPLDKASAQFDLAQAYFAAGQKDKAEENVLLALEAAPDYRPAQKLLLQLQDSEKGK